MSFVLLAACGGSDPDGGASPAPAPFPAQRSAELARLTLHAYRQLDDYLASRTFVPPQGYALQEQLFVSPGLAGELTGSPDPVPIGYVATRDGVIHVVFRGTRTADEWLADLDYPQVRVPWGGRAFQGFWRLYDALREALLGAVDSLIEAGTYHSVVFTGHSLGGALAVLGGAELAARSGPPVAVYTFGAPRVGDPGFVEGYAAGVETSWRVANRNDPVPGLPPRQVVNLEDGRPVTRTYAHVPRLHALEFADPADVAGSHALCGYHAALCAETDSPSACRARAADCAGG